MRSKTRENKTKERRVGDLKGKERQREWEENKGNGQNKSQ